MGVTVHSTEYIEGCALSHGPTGRKDRWVYRIECTETERYLPAQQVVRTDGPTVQNALKQNAICQPNGS
jgi:hypothetical protein